MGHNFSALFVLEEDDFLRYVVSETTPEYWFGLCRDCLLNQKHSLTLPQILELVLPPNHTGGELFPVASEVEAASNAAASREFFFGCMLCERLERFFFYMMNTF